MEPGLPAPDGIVCGARCPASMKKSRGFDGQRCDGVEAAGARVSSRRVVAAGLGAGPDVDDFEGDEFGGFDDEFPFSGFPHDPLGSPDQSVGVSVPNDCKMRSNRLKQKHSVRPAARRALEFVDSKEEQRDQKEES